MLLRKPKLTPDVENVQQKRKKADHLIIQIIIGIVIAAIIAGMTISVEMTLRVIGVILMFGYFIFIVWHLALLYPIAIIGFTVSDIIDDKLPGLVRTSTILTVALKAFLIISITIFIHISWGFIGISFITNTYTWANYCYWMSEV